MEYYSAIIENEILPSAATWMDLEIITISVVSRAEKDKYYMILLTLCLVTQSCLTLWPHGLEPIRPLCPWGFSRQKYWSQLPCPPPQDLSNSRIEPRSPALQVDSLPSEPPGKPKNTGVGSLSLLQGIFPKQELNQGLLHFRKILYQLSHQGSPISLICGI